MNFELRVFLFLLIFNKPEREQFIAGILRFVEASGVDIHETVLKMLVVEFLTTSLAVTASRPTGETIVACTFRSVFLPEAVPNATQESELVATKHNFLIDYFLYFFQSSRSNSTWFDSSIACSRCKL